MDELISIEKAAKLLGVDKKTLKKWELDGFLVAQRTRGGHRRYSITDITNLQGKETDNKNFNGCQVFCKVDSIKQKELVENILKLIKEYNNN
jgi:excisionase family DNA binding protein